MAHKRSSTYHPKWRPGIDQKKQRRKKRIRTTLVTLFLLCASVVFVATLAYRYLPIGKSSEPYYIYVTEQSTQEDVLAQVSKRTRVRYPSLLQKCATLYRLSSRIRPGRYLVPQAPSMQELFRLISKAPEALVTLTIPQNVRTQEQLIEHLTQGLYLKADTLRMRLKDKAYCQSLGFDTETIRTLFIPSKDSVSWYISCDSLLNLYQARYHQFWNEKRLALAAQKGFSPLQIAILASIVQEESSAPEEWGTIAGLYINRLNRGYKLQADPTARYAYGDFSIKRITRTQTSYYSPYNTYIVAGLPPAPICYPTAATLDSVLHYRPNNYYFMCAKADFSGRHAFASRYEEHLANAQAYQKALDQRNIK